MVAEKLRNAEPLATIRIPGDPSLPTRHRWYLTGVLDANGNRVKLECWKIGGRIYATPEAVDRFIVALSGDADPTTDDADDMTRRGREAGKALEALGC